MLKQMMHAQFLPCFEGVSIPVRNLVVVLVGASGTVIYEWRHVASVIQPVAPNVTVECQLATCTHGLRMTSSECQPL
jgi:hypothetical protein